MNGSIQIPLETCCGGLVCLTMGSVVLFSDVGGGGVLIVAVGS